MTQNRLNEQTIKKLITENSNPKKEENNILNFLIRISLGEMKKHGIIDNFCPVKPLILQEETEQILSDIYSELEIDFSQIELSYLKNSELNSIVDMFEKRIDRKIQLYYHSFSREKVLLTLLQFSTVLSQLTFSAYENVEENSKVSTLWDRLIYLWQTFHRDPLMDNRGFIGDLKYSAESAVNDLLLSDISFSKNTDLIPDLEKILTLYHAKTYLWQLKSVIPILFERRNEIILNSVVGIGIPEYLWRAFAEYQNNLKNVGQRILNHYTEQIFERFEKFYDFQPNTLWRYIEGTDNERAHKLENIGVSLSSKELLITDIQLNQSISRKGAENAVKMFILNDDKYYKMNSKEHFASSNNRLFRTPIIELEEFYLFPTNTFLETTMYLPKRILTRENGTKGSYENFMYLNEFDEYDLPIIQEFLNGRGIGSLINFNLSQIPKLKGIIEEKKITKEFDLLYLYQDILWIWDLKNWGFELNLFELKKDIQKIQKYKKCKQKPTQDFLLENKAIIEEYLGIKFNEIKLGILTVYPTAYNYIISGFDGGVQSVDEFLKLEFR